MTTAQAVLLTTGDVAHRLGVSPETVRFWERVGRLPAVKTERGTRLFQASDVDAWRLQRARRQPSVSRAAARRAG